MTTPTKLSFRAWHRPEVVFTLHDWLPQKGMAIVTDSKGERQVVSLVLPGRPALFPSAVFPTFPSSHPEIIEEVTLLPPPCRGTRQEADALRAQSNEACRNPAGTSPGRLLFTAAWEIEWLQLRETILLPKQEDDARLGRRLGAFKIKMQRLYDARKAELEQWRTKTYGQMVFLGGGRFYRWTGTKLVERGWLDFGEEHRAPRSSRQAKPANKSEEVESQVNSLALLFTRPVSDACGRPNGGYLNWTLEVAKYEPRIRDRILQRRWAKETGVDLVQMASQKRDFLHWYRAMRPLTPIRPRDLMGSLFDQRAPAPNTEQTDAEICAEVRFVVRFKDGSRVWLADCACRAPLPTDERKQFGANSGIPFPVSVERGNQSARNRPVFIGHGRSREWLALQNFLQNTLGLSCVEFNTESAAGVGTQERLLELLDRAGFAFLVMTGEDAQSDGSKRARENVVHEIGLFQGRLEFRKAIILLEEGCTEFSNIHGLGQIRFPKGGIESRFEDIRKVLEREKILKANSGRCF